jgi:thiosulfate/3-mercaptopyruvate sulfurtransferase
MGNLKRSERGGHIPSAMHLEWSELVDERGRFLAPPVVRAKLERAGIKPDEPIITHCQTGGRASVNAFVLDRLGVPSRNYYLGWSEWGNTASTPVVTGADAGPRP